MRKLTSIFSIFTMLLFSMATFAQSVLVVEPGIGTLNAAITANGGNKIYQLKAGGWYQLDAIIEHTGYHLQIIGEKPAAGQLPATLQTNSNAEGVVFNRMFNSFGNITIKGVYVMNVNLLGVTGANLLVQNDSMARIAVDNCVLDPISGGSAIICNGKKSKTYFTNNQVLRMGHQLSPNDGHFISYAAASGAGLDTLYVENNTFVCMGTGTFEAGFNKLVQNYVKFNHNTWIMQKSQFDWSNWEETYIFTNNLMFDAQTQPWSVTWQPMPGADKNQPLPCLIYADTIPGEVLPSTRQQFIEYNMLYRNPKFYTQLVALNQKGTEFQKPFMYYMPFLWPADSLKSREAQMFANKTAFPKWNFGNYTENIDPQWEDPMIYTHSDKFVDWTKYATYQHGLGLPSTEYPLASEWTKYHWDPDGDITNNLTWPVFNGKYKNPVLLTGSIENLPLGDLNWFPESKALWLSKKANIEAHIMAGNTNKISLTSVAQIKDQSMTIYPNPAKNEILIKGAQNADITIMSLDGRTMKAAKNVTKVNVSDIANGSYMITIKEGNRTSTQKLLIQK